MRSWFTSSIAKTILCSAGLIACSLVSFSQSQWGFSVASTEYYSADSTHREYCFFSAVVDISTLDCRTVNAQTILGQDREVTKVLSECLSRWFFGKLKGVQNDAVKNITSERALISQVEKMATKGKDCSDFDVQCLFQNREEAEKERKAFIKKAKKLGAVIFEIE